MIEIMSDEKFERYYQRMKSDIEEIGEDFDKRRKIIMTILQAGAGHADTECAFTQTQLKRCFELGHSSERKEP